MERPMTKITFIGAGSLGFTSEIVRDILTFPLLEGATISLMDINAERREFSKRVVEKINQGGRSSREGGSDAGSSGKEFFHD